MSNTTTGTLSVHTENIFPIIKKFLYSDHEIFLRELISNAQDACNKVKTLALSGEINPDSENFLVQIIVDKEAGTLTVRDNGIGMTAEEVEKYINQIAFSGAEEFVEKYKDAQIIGQFGLGFYSAFMVARQVEIHTLSQRKDAVAVKWSCDGSTNFNMESISKDTPGTDIILHIADDSKEFLEEDRIEKILDKYCRFMPVSIQFGTKSEWIEDESGEKDENGNAKRVEVKVPNIINHTEPLWTKKPADLADEDYLRFYRELYPMTFEEPLFHIHINVDYPFNLTGILYFPKLKNSFEIQKNKISLYCDQVFITDEVKNILPDFLTLLHGVVDSPDIPLNVSRSYLQEDSNVKKISSHITRKVADKLLSMFNNDRPDFEKKWDDIGTFIHYGMLTDEKFFEKANSFSLFRNTENAYYTFEEFRSKVGETQKDKSGNLVVLYATGMDEQYSYIQEARDRGYEVLILSGPLTPHLLSHLEMKNSGVRFKRVDADVTDKLIEKDEQQAGILSEEQVNALKPVVEDLAGKEKFSVEFAPLSPQGPPVVITQHEFSRRMKEQEALGGGNSFGFLPSMYNLVINSGSAAVEEWSKNPETSRDKIQHAIDLASLSQGLLKGEALSKFVKRSFELIS